jgi:hypothetical protein
MQHETIQLPHGYSAEIYPDESPENPFSAWDCEPPIAVLNWQRYHAKLENYAGNDLNLVTLLSFIPAEKWEGPEWRRAIMRAVPFHLEDITDAIQDNRGSFRDAIESLVNSLRPSGWSEWVEYFDAMEAVAALAGIPCHYTQSNGHSQGDSALVFVAALPAWVELAGAPADTLAEQCKTAADLWSAWAWGDVWGVARIISPDGWEVEEASCWGFYGSHEASGLLDHCRDIIQTHQWETEQEAAESHAMACRDIETAAA